MLVCYSKEDLLVFLQDQYYEYRETYSEEPPSYTHGGLPPEGVYTCKDCGAESGDGHNDACESRENYELIERFIEERLR